ncbi:MAG: CocE/NonD family hydrolase [Nocardiopsaceae bacterium]|nr:CocE/NonD family hydrolase [Nocardiopsaceae bacterium]
MRIDWQVPVPADDGLVLRADVYRPDDDGTYPAIVSYGPYAKGLAFQEGYGPQWEKMVAENPDVAEGTSARYACWEVADPEKWVPHGYACVRVDSRGAGASPGTIDVWSPREARDLAECIEWAAAQPWCNGKVGLSGISYYAMNQWHVAALHPPHLAAMIPWEGAADFYRDVTHHGGIPCDFVANWYKRQVTTVQYGLGSRSAVNPNTGEHVAGPQNPDEELDDAELSRNRADLGEEVRARPLDGPWYRDRSADWERVTVPFLSSANWGGQGLHPRGNFEAFTQAASEQKWLEVHGAEHWTHYYTDYGLDLQRRFFDHFLRDIDNGWAATAPVRLNIRHPGERFELRDEREWPLARTRWTRAYLDAESLSLRTSAPPVAPASVSYQALGDGVSFTLPAFDEPTELTGPMAARIFVSSSTDDADLFCVVRVLNPEGAEVTFQGALDPNTPVAQGWLRASHRRLDPSRSLPYRPYHPHDASEFLVPGEVVALDVEIWPTCIVVPAGYRVVLSVRGTDYSYEGPLSPFAQTFHYANRGVGPFTHLTDRPSDRYGGDVTIHTGADYPSYLLLPVIPSADESS